MRGGICQKVESICGPKSGQMSHLHFSLSASPKILQLPCHPPPQTQTNTGGNEGLEDSLLNLILIHSQQKFVAQRETNNFQKRKMF